MQHQKAWKPHHIFVPVHKATTRGGVGCGAEVDEARALEKCSMVGAQPVHLVIQLLYDLLWENRTAPFTHEKKQKTGSLLWSETRCCLMPLRVWCHCSLLRKEAESSKRGSSTWMGLREQYYFLRWHTRFPVISICWASFSPKNKMNGNFDFCFDCAWQLSVSWFLCTGSLLPLTEAGIWAVTAMLSGPPRASSTS